MPLSLKNVIKISVYKDIAISMPPRNVSVRCDSLSIARFGAKTKKHAQICANAVVRILLYLFYSFSRFKASVPLRGIARRLPSNMPASKKNLNTPWGSAFIQRLPFVHVSLMNSLAAIFPPLDNMCRRTGSLFWMSPVW